MHNMAAWNALTVEDQEKTIGRSKLSDIEMANDVGPPANSHVALNTIVGPDGQERAILRANVPVGAGGAGRVRHVRGVGYASHAERDRADAGQHVYWQPAR